MARLLSLLHLIAAALSVALLFVLIVFAVYVAAHTSH